MNRRHILALSVAATALVPLFALAETPESVPVPVVATFSILGDMVAEVGGERIALTTLVGPDGDGHVYQPTPADAQAVAGAALVVVNGAEFEGWIDRLIEAAEFDGPIVAAVEGVDLIAYGEEGHDDGHGDHGDDHDDHGHENHDDHGHDHDDHGHVDHDHNHDDHAHGDDDHDDHGHDDHAHGDFDPHAWQSLSAARVYVANIEAGLAAVDPEGAVVYAANAAEYLARIDALEAEIAALFAAIPEAQRTVVTSHDSFGYFAREHGIRFLAPQGISTDAEVSAADMARLITQIREEGITAVFVENIADDRLITRIASETGAVVGEALYSDALSGPEGPAATYLEMMRHNATAIAAALAD